MKKAYQIELKNVVQKKHVSIIQQGGMRIVVSLPNKYRNRLMNDHPEITMINQSKREVTILIDEYISKRLLVDIIRNATEQC